MNRISFPNRFAAVNASVFQRIMDQGLWLSPERALYWEEKRWLVASDLHFGKTGHFRKSGIAVPQRVYQEDLQRLVSLIHWFKPEQLVVVGDLFHSEKNTELEWFRKWREDLSSIAITLVKGNHDILHSSWYADAGIGVADEELRSGPFIFIHDKCRDYPGSFSFCGHVHPGVRIAGGGRQQLRFPCFHFTSTHCILPAFSRFTGMMTIEPQNGDMVYAIVEKELIRVH